MICYGSFAAAAEYLGFSIRTIRRNIESIPHHRTPFGIRFSKDDLDAYMATFRVEPRRAVKVDLDDVLPRRKRSA